MDAVDIWDFQRVMMTAAEGLERRAQMLRLCAAPLVGQHSLQSDCRASDIDALNLRGGCAVYMLFLTNEEDIPRAQDGYARLAASKSHKLARNNKRQSSCLYVGSKTKGSVATRLKEHCGLRDARTFALHIRHWPGSTFNIQVEIAYLGEAETAVVHELEDALWEKHRPMFGKKGRQ